jgi:hypothetical protein
VRRPPCPPSASFHPSSVSLSAATRACPPAGCRCSARGGG